MEQGNISNPFNNRGKVFGNNLFIVGRKMTEVSGFGFVHSAV